MAKNGKWIWLVAIPLLVAAMAVGIALAWGHGLFGRGNTWRGVKMEAAQIAVGQRYNVPVAFYGWVVDQDGKGIPEVIIAAQYTVFSTAEHLRGQTFMPHAISTVTDAKGNFEFRISSGTSLVITHLTKAGYRYDDNQVHTYTYANDTGPIFKPDTARPEVFSMWKKGAKIASLITFSGRELVQDSGKTLSVWLGVPSKIRAGSYDDADFQITVSWKLPPDMGASNGPKSRFDWYFKVDVPQGGIIASKDVYLYRAPDDGYASHYEYSQQATDPDWRHDNNLSQRYYLKSRNGIAYSNLCLHVKISPERHVASIRFDGDLNPDGSRNLEPQP